MKNTSYIHLGHEYHWQDLVAILGAYCVCYGYVL